MLQLFAGIPLKAGTDLILRSLIDWQDWSDAQVNERFAWAEERFGNTSGIREWLDAEPGDVSLEACLAVLKKLLSVLESTSVSSHTMGNMVGRTSEGGGELVLSLGKEQAIIRLFGCHFEMLCRIPGLRPYLRAEHKRQGEILAQYDD